MLRVMGSGHHMWKRPVDEVRLVAAAVREERSHLICDVPAGHQYPHVLEERSLKVGCSDEVEPGHLQDDQDRLKMPDSTAVSVEVPPDTEPDCMLCWSANIPVMLSIDQTASGMSRMNAPGFLKFASQPLWSFCQVFVGASIG